MLQNVGLLDLHEFREWSEHIPAEGANAVLCEHKQNGVRPFDWTFIYTQNDLSNQNEKSQSYLMGSELF